MLTSVTGLIKEDVDKLATRRVGSDEREKDYDFGNGVKGSTEMIRSGQHGLMTSIRPGGQPQGVFDNKSKYSGT